MSCQFLTVNSLEKVAAKEKTANWQQKFLKPINALIPQTASIANAKKLTSRLPGVQARNAAIQRPYPYTPPSNLAVKKPVPTAADVDNTYIRSPYSGGFL